MVTTARQRQPKTKVQTHQDERPTGNWPADIGEAYGRYPGPYTIQNAEVLIEEEPLEIYNGWLVWQDMTDAIERRIAAVIQVILDLAARVVNFGQAYPDQFECLMINEDVFKPDVCLVSKKRYDSKVETISPTSSHHVLKAGPELVVEIRSPSNRRTKERLKRQIYFENGTVVVWDVDYKKRKIWVYEAADPSKPKEYTDQDEITCESILPGWHRSVADFFAADLTAEQIVGQAAEQWRAESRAEERLKVLRETLIQLGRGRFAGEELPADLEGRLSRYDLAQLTTLIGTIAVSSNLKEWLETLPE